MGYFSNGTEGEIYRATYCENCVHWRLDEAEPERGYGCPIWDLHLCYNREGDKADLLNMLIPRSKCGCFNEQCTMFHGKHWREDEPTLPLEDA